ncbi:XTP/dITP diphosphohydrolase [Propioniferax innocua]|uniref:XTP/dITP diphosphohydrolase n=2 Tax=Propioniferax innocua TaxID=1753 RepID=A0A542ZC19_9ACTN|nr:XTP/dITP diphosphohydrolase [Propioniferax innocua]
MTSSVDELRRLAEVMTRLRVECPWDAKQTHRSLVRYLVEETGEVVDAIEAGTDADLREELGDLLLQVYFHAEIARTEGRFDIDDVARGITDKLVERHPYVFSDDEVPDDLNATWEERKRREKGRTSSLDGIPHQVSAMTRAAKVVSRARSHRVPVELADEPITAEEIGAEALTLVERAHASGVDPEQALRDALRELEASVQAAEGQL